jgi:acyl-[acyl carrier protein]--UDP-N-acetylglucosamine O-acyltransferase
MSCNIHPTAIVDSAAELGEGVQIGAFSVIGPNVKIGDRCNIPIMRYFSLPRWGPNRRTSNSATNLRC